MQPIEIIMIIVVVALVGGVVAYSVLIEHRRRETLHALAQSMGFQFHMDKDRDHDGEYAQFEVFRKGRDRVAHNTIVGTVTHGEHEFHLRMGDFKYVTGSGKNRSTHRFSYLILHIPWNTPALLLRREGFFDKVAGAIGFDDIDFESAEFSRRFHIKSDDKRFAYDIIHPQMMEWLLATMPPMIEVERGAICIADGKNRWDPPAFKRHLQLAHDFLERWPNHVVDRLETHQWSPA